MSETYTASVTVKKAVAVAENASGMSRDELNRRVAEATKEEQAKLQEAMEAVLYSLLAYGEDRTKDP